MLSWVLLLNETTQLDLCLIDIWNEFCAEQVIDGLDKAVKNMKKGEIAVVTIHPDYAFGSSESPQELATVPANSNVHYEVELLSFVKVSIISYVNYFLYGMFLQLKLQGLSWAIRLTWSFCCRRKNLGT